jgi:hypothetical protein
MPQGVFCGFVFGLSAPLKTLGHLDYFFSSFVGGGASFDSSHKYLFGYSRQHFFDKFIVDRRHLLILSFSSGFVAGFFGVEVVLMGQSIHYFLTAGYFNSL